MKIQNKITINSISVALLLFTLIPIRGWAETVSSEPPPLMEEAPPTESDPARTNPVVEDPDAPLESPPAGHGFGILGSYLNNNMKSLFTAGTPANPKTVEANMNGVGYGLSLMYKTPLTDFIEMQLMMGAEQFNVSTELSDTHCAAQTSATCNVKINFLAAHSLLKYRILTRSEQRYWVGAGLGFLFAITKSSSVLDADKINANGLYIFSFGMDWLRKSGKEFIPIEIDFALFPSSPDVSAKMLVLRAGYGWQY